MTNQLEQLKELSTVVADTGSVESIKSYSPQDATTNPSLLLQAASLPEYAEQVQQAIAFGQQHDGSNAKRLSLAADKLAVLIGKEILQLVPDYVSTEVDARLSFDTWTTVSRARRLIDLYRQEGVNSKRVLIKIAATWEGIAAARQLERDGIKTNVTLLFGMDQARACADSGVFMISPFVGRILDWYKKADPERVWSVENDPGVQSVRRIYNHYKANGYSTTVMGASFRNIDQIRALAGCDRLTISPTLLAELEQSSAPLAAGLSPGQPQSEDPNPPVTEPSFRWAMNEDAMATEKLAEGIRNFAADQVRLEQLLDPSHTPARQ